MIKYRIGLSYSFFIFLILIGGVISLFQIDQSSWRAWVLILCFPIALLGLIMVLTLRIERTEWGISAAYVIRNFRYSLYSLHFEDVNQIDYAESMYAIHCTKRAKPILLTTAIKGHKEILQAILESSPKVTLTPSAQKQILKTKGRKRGHT